MQCLNVLKQIRSENEAFSDIRDANNAQLPNEASGSIRSIAPRDLPTVDAYLDKLQTSDKVKSGFVGVYANGKGFRAVGCRPDGSGGAAAHSIGTFPTAEQAAVARLFYYQNNKLPYGKWADVVDKRRAWLCEQGNSQATFDEALEFENDLRMTQGHPPIKKDADGNLSVGGLKTNVDDGSSS